MYSEGSVVSIGRRRFVHSQLLLGGCLLAGPGATAFLHAQQAPNADAEQRLGKFFRLSRTLLSPLPLNTQLDRRVAVRMLAALNAEYPNFSQQLDIFPDDPGGRDRHSPVARLIIAAWYTGVVGKQLVTYERAIMYRLVSDALPVPTYCTGEPGSWASAPQLRFGRV